jgi:TonB-dependent SusC/RagA subfamily outer membrane receptor
MLVQRIRRLIGAMLLLPLLVACSGRSSGPEVGRMRSASSGNVLTAEEIEDSNLTPNSVLDLLVRMPGIISTGRSVTISGLGGQPLFVVNNVPQSDAAAAMGLNPRDIARIEIVKTGGATAEYGFRGANGVILITTKR